MFICEVTKVSNWVNEAMFFNPKCGHKQTFRYSVQPACQHKDCMALVPDVKRLFDMDKAIGEDNFQMARVKHFAESRVK